MDLSLSLFMFLRFLCLLSLLHLITTLSTPLMRPLCHDDESSALLEFKESFIINKSASLNPSAYPKVASWSAGDKSNCCSWDGVLCDEDTGHVIGLDLSSSCLYGSVGSNSSLFRLVHLQMLSLADNYFQHSRIPPQVGNLSSLTHLNLSASSFSGQIPLEVSQLSRLAALDLSINFDIYFFPNYYLELKNPSLANLLGNLTRLEELNLGWVDISSAVPSTLANLSSLTSLVLYDCRLNGEFPVDIFKLPNLRFLNLNRNENLTGFLPEFTWRSPLEELVFSDTQFSGALPSSMGNLGFLTVLEASSSNLSGSIPSSLGNLTNIICVNLSNNHLVGNLPSSIENMVRLSMLDFYFNQLTGPIPLGLVNLTQLNYLSLSHNHLVSNLPSSLGNMIQLSVLDFYFNQLTGPIPLGLVNLTQLNYLTLSHNHLVGNLPSAIGNMVQLSMLDFSSNQLTGPIPLELVNLTQLDYLSLSHNHLVGNLLFSIGNMVQLSELDFSSNQLTGHLGLVNLTQLTALFLDDNLFTGPVSFGARNHTRLTSLVLQGNKLVGQIPNSIFNLENLGYLDLSLNYFSGTLEFEMFAKLKHLSMLYLSGNQGPLLIKETSVNATLPKFHRLGLSSCNFAKFPGFLRNQDALLDLDLSSNNIRGLVPEWVWNASKLSLSSIDLSNNFLTGFDQLYPLFVRSTNLKILDLRSNLFQGPLPIPPVSLKHYYGSKNSFSGNIPEVVCNLSSLQVLDLANNNLSGSLPQCSDSFGDSLLVLDLQGNRFHGSIPPTWTKSSYLRMVSLSRNRFEGRVPRSLARCTRLEVLDLSNNHFSDMFPSWLGNLPQFAVLILRSNKFIGPIESPKFHFLRILDISYNGFSGKLPLQLFGDCSEQELADYPAYFQINSTFNSWSSETYTYSTTMTNKGTNRFYEKVRELFKVIDMSSNKFVGEIPKSVGNLTGLQLLNLSNNLLNGHIPPSLGDLLELEAMDLSRNKLAGEIPQQLTKLTFLAVFNVSYNHLTGPVPQGKQFDTFGDSCFEGNTGLCGGLLTKKCMDINVLPPSESQHSSSPFEFGWKIVVIGYGVGAIVGVIIGQVVFAWKQDWLMKTFRIRQPIQRKANRRRRRYRIQYNQYKYCM